MLAYSRLLSERSRVRLAPGARSTGTTVPPETGACVAIASAKRTATTVLHALLLPLAGLAFALLGITHDAPVGGWVGHDTAAAQRPAAVPTWDSHGGVAGCRSMRAGELVDTVLVVTQQGDTARMDFDRAWAQASDAEHANDVYVIGACE